MSDKMYCLSIIWRGNKLLKNEKIACTFHVHFENKNLKKQTDEHGRTYTNTRPRIKQGPEHMHEQTYAVLTLI